MRRFSTSLLLLLAGCAPASTDGTSAVASTSLPRRGPEPIARDGAPQTLDVDPGLGSDADAPVAPTRGGGVMHRNAPPPTQGEVPSSRTGWDRGAVGGMGDGYGGGGSDPVASTSLTVGGATYLGGTHVDIRGTAQRENLFEYTITSTDSGWVEAFLFQKPSNPVVQQAPLLVVWHKFGSSHLDAQFNTDFLEEADARGWYVVTPLSAATKHFGAREAQMNTELVLEFVMSYFGSGIDPNRIYSVGFSMGGGAQLAYAANHVDPSKPMFAAIVSHTGGGSLEYTYVTSPDDDDVDDDIQTGQRLETPDILDFWFGGGPTVQPFEYQRHSVMSIDGFGVVDHSKSMITNLVHVPVHTWYAINDPKVDILTQTQIIQTEFLTYYGGTSVLTQVPASTHTWNHLDEVAALDWLEQFSLALPTSGHTLADEDGTWFYFDVEQDAAGSFTPFDWTVDDTTNTLVVTGTSNLQRITVDSALAGLDPAATLTLQTGSNDATGDEIRFRGVATAPVTVQRDGLSDPSWSYDAPTQTLTITEPDGAPHTWVVAFQ